MYVENLGMHEAIELPHVLPHSIRSWEHLRLGRTLYDQICTNSYQYRDIWLAQRDTIAACIVSFYPELRIYEEHLLLPAYVTKFDSRKTTLSVNIWEPMRDRTQNWSLPILSHASVKILEPVNDRFSKVITNRFSKVITAPFLFPRYICSYVRGNIWREFGISSGTQRSPLCVYFYLQTRREFI